MKKALFSFLLLAAACSKAKVNIVYQDPGMNDIQTLSDTIIDPIDTAGGEPLLDLNTFSEFMEYFIFSEESAPERINQVKQTIAPYNALVAAVYEANPYGFASLTKQQKIQAVLTQAAATGNMALFENGEGPYGEGMIYIELLFSDQFVIPYYWAVTLFDFPEMDLSMPHLPYASLWGIPVYLGD
ncbi:hypothetical protein HB364_26280 [Pseudoflavitalea sp. X16]|uniref:hypothetical protein n=1 Tax=Paraflavitalea devenefica TaxID=2716334 RepID=UPI001420E688|nr:hypothetical protein [Paraflavitalea devenefica]NII28619.1 hypothetical protein [Paraflavitalea devenefica]